jgi:HPt (histidine-containing phosphotransfer) domain-containing protein
LIRDEKDLPNLSSLGHYLKGSSAALGVTHVQASCEKIQHYGALRDEDKNENLSTDQALILIRRTLARCKKDYAVAHEWLREFYDESAEDS